MYIILIGNVYFVEASNFFVQIVVVHEMELHSFMRCCMRYVQAMKMCNIISRLLTHEVMCVESGSSQDCNAAF